MNKFIEQHYGGFHPKKPPQSDLARKMRLRARQLHFHGNVCLSESRELSVATPIDDFPGVTIHNVILTNIVVAPLRIIFASLRASRAQQKQLIFVAGPVVSRYSSSRLIFDLWKFFVSCKSCNSASKSTAGDSLDRALKNGSVQWHPSQVDR